MALPAKNSPWPPPSLASITDKHREWDAWYSGDTSELFDVYRTSSGPTPYDAVSAQRGGLRGALRNFWWGKPRTNLTTYDADKLHVPLAADLCQASADLLYAEAPTITSEDDAAQAELDLAVERGLVTVLAEGNELGAALGDAYYRVTWDGSIADRSFITSVDADAAWPEFRWGQLVAVTFWWVVEVRDTVWLRHVERHELAGVGLEAEGIVLHGLYQGTSDNLGVEIPLTEHRSTAGITVDENAMIATGSPGLAVVHVPNQRPQRRFRKHPTGSNLGRSDLDGNEATLDKIDMVWSSWMRDIRLAKSRLIVPAFMLESNGPGKGVAFDSDQDVYSTVNAPPRDDGRNEITAQQFTIRIAEHRDTINELVGVVLQHTGYGEQTFGEAGDVAQTATEVDARDRRSNLTRDRKIRAAEGPLNELMRKKLAVDRVWFGTGVPDDAEVTFRFSDSTQVNPLQLAQTNAALYTAQAASTKTRVQMQHPDWDETQVDAEVALILTEFAPASVPDPGSFRLGEDDEQPPADDTEDQSPPPDEES